MLESSAYGFFDNLKHGDPLPCRSRSGAKIHRSDFVECGGGPKGKVVAVDPARDLVAVGLTGGLVWVRPNECEVVDEPR